MAKLLAFRLHNDTGYSKRYASLVAAMGALTSTRWDQGTALYLFHHPATPLQIHGTLMANSDLYRNEDMLLVVDLPTGDYASSGVLKPELLNFILSLKKSPSPTPRSAVAEALLSRA